MTAFHEKLSENGVEAEVDHLIWSGANSVIQRDVAARVLAENLAHELEQNPDQTYLLIAHSHGGNVALRAMHILKREFAIPGSLLSNIQIATIATPFLTITMARDSWFKLGAVLSIALTFALSIFFSVVALPSQDWSLPTITWVAMVTFLSYLGWLGLGINVENDLEIIPDKIISRSTYSSYKGDFGLLIIRGFEDEASLALSLSSLNNRIADYTIAIGSLAMFVTVAPTLIGLLWDLVFGSTAFRESAIGQFGLTASLFVTSLVFSFVILAALSRRFFGSEVFSSPLSLTPSVQTVPDLDAPTRVITLSRSQQSDLAMLHGLYEHPECASSIVDWVLERS